MNYLLGIQKIAHKNSQNGDVAVVNVRWKPWERDGLEHCLFCETNDGISVEGVVAGGTSGKYGAYYFVKTDSTFRTREVRVAYVGGPCLHLESDGAGGWRDLVGERSLAFLKGCIDVDIGFTPATNTLPIKRLDLQGQESKEIAVAYVPLPSEITSEFLPYVVDQRYTCLSPNRIYLYEGLSSSFSAEIEVDEYGLVLGYPNIFRRIVG